MTGHWSQDRPSSENSRVASRVQIANQVCCPASLVLPLCQTEESLLTGWWSGRAPTCQLDTDRGRDLHKRGKGGGGGVNEWVNEWKLASGKAMFFQTCSDQTKYVLINTSLCKSIPKQLNQRRNVWSRCPCSLCTFPARTDAQDVTFYSIEEVTLHHKDVARQHPCCAHFSSVSMITRPCQIWAR